MGTDEPVASVCERCDDESSRVPQVLVSVWNGRRDHPHHHRSILPVITQLACPAKVLWIADLSFGQTLDYISRCDIKLLFYLNISIRHFV